MRAPLIPLSVKVPLIVVALMVCVSVGVSQRVMSTLVATQERHIRDLGTAYLDGLTSSLLPHILRGDAWEVFDTLDRSGAIYQTVRPLETVVLDQAGLVLAATDPARAPSFEPLPDRLQPSPDLAGTIIDERSDRAHLEREVLHQGVQIGSIHTVLDVRTLIEARRETITALIATNAILTIVLTAVGYFAMVKLMSPMRLLTEHLAHGADRPPVPIPARRMPQTGSEAHQLLSAYNALVAAERERARLASHRAEEVRLASLGRLAAGMAHEINNPLGGLFAAIDTLKRHGEQPAVRARATGLLERGLGGIRDVVAAALHAYRPERTARSFCAGDLDDVRTLVMPEIRRKSILPEWIVALGPDGEEGPPGSLARQVLLNLVLNAIAASPAGGAIVVEAQREEGAVVLTVSDAGAGLPPSLRQVLLDPAATAPIGREAGLGLWMIRRVVSELGGTVGYAPSRFGGAAIRVCLPVSGAARREVVDAAA